MIQNTLMGVKPFIETYFDKGSAPSPRTVINWIKSGAVKGKIINNNKNQTYYVDHKAWSLASGDSEVDDFLTKIE